ncbi:hypothetical protein ACTA71_003781 [Dictyostelium dimigraforme]
MKLLITITPNLEKLLQNEIKEILKLNKLQIPKLNVIDGGIEIDLSKDINRNDKDYYLWSISNCSRLAESIRIRFGNSFPSKNFNQFNSNLENLDFKTFFPTSSIEPQVMVSCSGSTLYHTNAIKERFIDHFNKTIKSEISVDINNSKFKPIKKLLKNLKYKLRKLQIDNQIDNKNYNIEYEDNENDNDEIIIIESEEEILNKINKLQNQLDEIINDQKNIPQTKVFIRIENNQAQLSIDACTSSQGELFHKRTPNKHISEAPIRETLASAIIMAIINNSNIDLKETNIWDPFVGSGTLIQEAIGILLKSKPSNCTNYKRSFQFERFKNHSTERYLKYLHSINKPVSSLIKNTLLIGSDIDQKAIDSSIFNLSNQGYQHDNIKFFKGDFQSILSNQLLLNLNNDKNLKPFTIITNLPYGARILNKNNNSNNYEHDHVGDDDGNFSTKKLESNKDINIYLNNNLSKDLKDLFKRFGDMIQESNQSILKNVFVLNGNSHFQLISTNNGNHNFNWERILHFKNGGLSVELLKMIKKN